MFKRFINGYFVNIFLVTIIAICTILPLALTKSATIRGDTWFHLQRIVDIRTSLEGFNLFNMVNLHSFGNAGQAINAMYPSWTLTILVALTMPLSAVAAWYGIGILILIFSEFSMYFVLKKINFNTLWATIYAIAYAFSAFGAKFYLGQMGSLISYIVYPLIFLGILKIQDTEEDAYLWIGIGLGAVLLTHLLTAVLLIGFLGLLFLIDVFILRKNNVVAWIKAFGLSILIGLPSIIVPITMRGAFMSPSWFDLRENMVDFSTLLSRLIGYGVNVPVEQVLVGLFEAWGSLMAVLFVYMLKKQYRSVALVGFFFVLISTGLVPWEFLSNTPLSNIQFPYRIAQIGLVFLSILGIVAIENKAMTYKGIHAGVLLIFFVILSSTMGYSMIHAEKINNQQLIQKQDQWVRYKYSLNNDTLRGDSRNKGRVYIDYMPIENQSTAVLQENGKNSSSASKEMIDVNQNHSLRRVDFDNKEIVFEKQGQNVVSYPDNAKYVKPQHPVKIKNTTGNSLHMKTPKVDSGKYELPFWGYKSMKYRITVNGKQKQIKISSHGRMIAQLDKGVNDITITSYWTTSFKISVLIMTVSLIGSITLLILKQKPIKNAYILF
ncbi:hypothetical protein [Weissella minor]|uniref:hypothetical protein n=1 Tax=Weissella minor TaxID=1620 RepID=UPI003AF2CC16